MGELVGGYQPCDAATVLLQDRKLQYKPNRFHAKHHDRLRDNL